MSADKTPALLVLFDGSCNLCNYSVRFITRHDKKRRFNFEPLQSDTGKKIIQKHGLNYSELTTIVFIENNVAYTRSSAALHITKYLDGLYPLLYGLLIVPPFIRNFIYDFVSKRRYKWFGKTKQQETGSC
jgi:predicted DCC family thiol-disulfide oxidoreductase YuxK